MKTTTLRRILAASLATIMALCVLTGCAKEPAQQTEPQDAGATLPVGMFVLTAGVSINVSYDIDGLVVEVEGNNESGMTLADGYTDYLGKPCADVAKELILAASKAALLTANTSNIVIKQIPGVPLPGTNFLENIETAVKTAVEEIKSTAVITLIDSEKLDEDGYINFETAQALLCNELGVEKLDAYYGLSYPTDGQYICTAEVAGVQTYHAIDATTGVIAEATDEELMGDPNEDFLDETTDEEYWADVTDPTEEEIIDDATINTVPIETEEELFETEPEILHDETIPTEILEEEEEEIETEPEELPEETEPAEVEEETEE